MKILFEDESILVIDKPSGLLSIVDGYDSSLPHLRSILEHVYGKLWIIHRLDKETSGVVVLARNAHAHQILNDQFSNRAIQKEYRALVFGTFPQTLNVSFQLRINADRRHRTRVDPIIGKPSSTDFSLIENIHNSAAYISASPHTGYTHQIRAHLLSAGFPILGDPLYNSAASRQFSKDLPIQRTALHAYQITFIHPLSGELITFHAEIPLDMQESLEFLNKN